MKILYKYKEIKEVKNSLEGLNLILEHSQNLNIIQHFDGTVLQLDKYLHSDFDPFVVVNSFYFSKDYRGQQLKDDHIGYKLEELLKEVHLYDYTIKTGENTRQEIIDKLESLSMEELKNINNSLTSEPYTDRWYYTYEELLDMHFNSDVRTFIQHINKGYVDLNEEYLFYEEVTGSSYIESISREDLEESLKNDTGEMAEFLYKYQEESEKPALELIEDYSRDI